MHYPDLSSYLRVDQMDDEDELSDENLKLNSSAPSPRRPRGNQSHSSLRRFVDRYWVWISNGILLLISLLFFCLWVDASRQKCGLQVYSPANVAVKYKKSLVTVNGSLDFPSEFHGKPCPAVDNAWARISEDSVKPIRLTKEQLLKVGKKDTPSKVKFLDEDGGGYMAALENLLRKMTYREYYERFDAAYSYPILDTFRDHLDHCIEMLRQSIMCHADVGVLVYDWVKGYDRPHPDFNVQHQCRDIDRILVWTRENKVHVPKDRILRLEGEVDLDVPP